MDHNVVVREKMTERYFLDELDSEARSQFEEHFFECQECAQDVQAAALFVERSKIVLSQPAVVSHPATPLASPGIPKWVTWLKPSVVAPVMALLLVAWAYQSFVTLPQMKAAISTPHVLQWTSVNVGTFNGEGNAIRVAPGSGFLLFVRIPPDGSYRNYRADLYNPAGKLEWSLTIPAAESQDQWPVQVPAAHRPAGTYTLLLQGISSAGESKKVGQASFELQFEK